MIRITASDLEEYRIFLGTPDDSDDPYEMDALVRALTSPIAPRRHGLYPGRVLKPEYYFEARGVGVVPVGGEIEIELPGVHDIACSAPVGGARLSARVNAVGGSTLHGLFYAWYLDVEEIMRSAYWRTALHVFGANKFVHHVLTGCEYTQFGREPRATQLERVEMVRYRGMDEEITQLANEAAAFWVRHIA